MTGHSAEVKIELVTRNARINLWSCGPGIITFRPETQLGWIDALVVGVSSTLILWVDSHPISWTVKLIEIDRVKRTGQIQTTKYPANEASRGSEGERIPSSP